MANCNEHDNFDEARRLPHSTDKLLKKGIHPSDPTLISEEFQKAAAQSTKIPTAMATPANLNNRKSLLMEANTSLNSRLIVILKVKLNWRRRTMSTKRISQQFRREMKFKKITKIE